MPPPAPDAAVPELAAVGLAALPVVLLRRIFNELDVRAKAALGAACKHLRSACRDPDGARSTHAHARAQRATPHAYAHTAPRMRVCDAPRRERRSVARCGPDDAAAARR